jgi:hypothetical protein
MFAFVQGNPITLTPAEAAELVLLSLAPAGGGGAKL